jgi:hypothetical protein
MYQPMLFLHWKQIRMVLIPFVIAAFGLPLLSVQGLGNLGGAVTLEPLEVLQAAQGWLAAYPLLAAAIGITLALSAWNWDHQLKHVYALSLPISRREYAMAKMGAGAVLALVPVGAFWVGALVASAAVHLPAGLHAYPNGLALRFLLAVMVSYATMFALAAGTIRTTLIVLSTVLLYFVLGGAVQSYLGLFFPFFQHTNVVGDTLTFLGGLGPFTVFTGSWMLIDV